MGIVVCLLIAAVYSVELLSAGRAFVGAEGQWSRAQKDAAFQLQRYVLTGAEIHYENFERALAVPLGDRKARIEQVLRISRLNATLGRLEDAISATSAKRSARRNRSSSRGCSRSPPCRWWRASWFRSASSPGTRSCRRRCARATSWRAWAATSSWC